MPEVVNTSFLGSNIDAVENPSEEIMVKVEDVSMVFNMANETMNNLKEYAIALAKGQLRFKEFRALDDVSLEVHKGDVFGILGTNGSGKSTLLKIIAGVLEPSEGTCTINGNIAPLIELGAGFDMELTARENIYLNGALLGYSKGFIEDHFDEIVDFAEIETFLDMPLKNYSSGMVARIAFAIATAIIPDILIVDEVLSVGDFMFQQKCERRISQLIEEHGVTVLIVSHDNYLIERLCNKAIWIEKGRTRIKGSAQEVCKVYRVLGGHVGSSEAERKVLDLLRDPLEPDMSLMETFAGDNRYSASVNIASELVRESLPDKVILASGENQAICLLANAFSSLENTPILLTQSDRLPDIIAEKLSQIEPSDVLIIGGSNVISEAIIKQVGIILPKSNVTRIGTANEENTAFELFEYGSNLGWGRKAILTYKECIGDMFSFMPYAYQNRIPLFFSIPNEPLNTSTVNALVSGHFDEILLLGGEDAFPSEHLKPLADTGIPIERFCGKDPFDANNIILDWVDRQKDSNTVSEVFVVPIWEPSFALAVGPLTKKRSAAIRVADVQNLDSVADNLDYLAVKGSTLARVVFFGDATQFNELDKSLLLKALKKTYGTKIDARGPDAEPMPSSIL